jgi:hypothetical protein
MKAFSYLLALLCILSSIFVFKLVYSEISASTVPFDTDESDHANPSLELYTAIKRGNAVGIYQSIVRQAFYPPAYSFAVASSYLISGVNLVSSRLPALLCFILYCILLVTAVFGFLKSEPNSNPALICACLTLIFAVTSPITIFNSSLCMLELPGLVTVSLCLIFFLRGNALLAVLAGLLVFFTKYNFGIITIPAVLLTICLSRSIKEAIKYGILTIAAISLWVLLTDAESFIHFFKGHKSYAPLLSKENLFFEINSWLDIYSITYTTAAALLFLALIGGIKYFKRPAAMFAVFNTLFAFFVLALSTTNEERHFMVALPGILFLSGLGLNFFFEYCRPNFLKLIASSIFIFFAYHFYQGVPEIKNRLEVQYEGEPGFSDLFKFIYENTGTASPVLLYGVSDSFSIEALRWYFAAQSGKAYTEVSLDAYPYRDDKDFTARKRKRNRDKPFLDPKFPKSPLNSILEKSYYGYAVHILNKEKAQRFKKEGDELQATLAPKLINKSASGSHEVEVYSLSPSLVKKPNIIILLADTLRADHLGKNGYSRNTSPVLDNFAAENVDFTYAVSPSSWTIPSVASLFTGLYPSAHGVMPRNRETISKLNDDFETLAEALKKEGYSTAAIAANFLVSAKFGLDQGFEQFDTARGETAERITKRAINYLDHAKSLKNPFFLYVHYMDPHHPYQPPPPFNKMFAGPLGSYSPEVMADISLYDGEIRFTDTQIGELLSWLKKQGLFENSIVIITSDHGEQFGERGHLGHGNKLFSEEVRVPLMISAKGMKTKINIPVSLVDIYPTLLSFAGSVTNLPVHGYALFDNIKARKNEGVLSEVLRDVNQKAFINATGEKLISQYPLDNELANLTDAMVESQEIYDTKTDYAEVSPLNNQTLLASLDKEYRELYAGILKAKGPYPQIKSEADEEIVRDLKTLGYIK